MNYRVRIAIYADDGTSTPELPEVWTDEPLYSGPAAAEETAVQARRTHRHFLNHLTTEQFPI